VHNFCKTQTIGLVRLFFCLFKNKITAKIIFDVITAVLTHYSCKAWYNYYRNYKNMLISISFRIFLFLFSLYLLKPEALI